MRLIAIDLCSWDYGLIGVSVSVRPARRVKLDLDGSELILRCK